MLSIAYLFIIPIPIHNLCSTSHAMILLILATLYFSCVLRHCLIFKSLRWNYFALKKKPHSRSPLWFSGDWPVSIFWQPLCFVLAKLGVARKPR